MPVARVSMKLLAKLGFFLTILLTYVAGESLIRDFFSLIGNVMNIQSVYR